MNCSNKTGDESATRPLAAGGVILVLLTVSREGVRIMTSNGRSRMTVRVAIVVC